MAQDENKSKPKEPTIAVELTARELAELSTALWESAQVKLALWGSTPASEEYRAFVRQLRNKLISNIEEIPNGSDERHPSR